EDGGQAYLAHAGQTARAQLELEEAFAIGPQSDFIVDARGHVAEMRRRNVRAADRLEIEHVDRVLGTLDEVFRPERRPHDGVGKFYARGRAFTREGRKTPISEQRAGCQELQKPATARGLID